MLFRLFGALATAVFALLVATLPANAVTYSVLWNFKTTYYGGPYGRLLLQDGAVYGTTSGQPYGKGLVFELVRSGGSWTAKALVDFNFRSGFDPQAGLVRDASGVLYGTTAHGGGRAGTVFQLTQSQGKWTESIIHAFGGRTDGSNPQCDLTLVKSTGELFGTTYYGGEYSYGTVFKLSRSKNIWMETVLYSFQGNDGAFPTAGLHRDSTGALYGTTGLGGSQNYGTVFKLTPSNGTWTETTLYNFDEVGGDGPVGLLIADTSGALYGTRSYGGAYGNGTVFKLARSNGEWVETVLWNFKGPEGDGAYPAAGLYMDSAGALYGTTSAGGGYGYGTVFKLMKAKRWTESVLHSFGSSSDGTNPQSALAADTEGHLYGTTSSGGKYGYGTVFSLTP